MKKIDELRDIRKKINELEIQETELVNEIIGHVGHDKEVQKSYDFEGLKIVIKTGENIRLDKNMLNTLWQDDMPINRTYSYTLRKKDYDAQMKSGSVAMKKLLSQIVTTAPAKPSLKIEE